MQGAVCGALPPTEDDMNEPGSMNPSIGDDVRGMIQSIGERHGVRITVIHACWIDTSTIVEKRSILGEVTSEYVTL